MSDQVRHIVCPACSAVNRIPACRSALDAKCGSCHQKLFTGKPAAVDGKFFRRHITRNDIPVLVDFWAPWCEPCVAMAPAYERAAAELEPRYRLLKVNADEEPALMAEFGIRSIPTLMLFANGRVVGQHAGAMNTPDISAWAQAQLQSAD
jgi:thioredoxin 2